jgi:hypothetical protein
VRALEALRTPWRPSTTRRTFVALTCAVCCPQCQSRHTVGSRNRRSLRVPPPRRLFLPCCLQPVANGRLSFAAADLVWSARSRGRLPIRGNHWTESNFRRCRLTSCGTYTYWLMRFSPRGWLLRRLNSKDDLSNSVRKTSRTTQEDKAGPPVHAGGLSLRRKAPAITIVLGPAGLGPIAGIDLAAVATFLPEW